MSIYILNYITYTYVVGSGIASVQTVSNFIGTNNATIVSSFVVSDTTYTVTSIGDSAFGNRTLTGVTIPNSVTSIGYQAFANSTITATITIPNSVTSIGSYAFYNCNSINTIPDSVTSIGDNAFHNSRNINCTIPNSIISIGNSAFQNCINLNTPIVLPNTLTSLGSSAFQYCNNITTVTISNSLTIIQAFTFSGCTQLTTVTIPNSVTIISDSAFYDCSRLSIINIPNSVTTIEHYAFYNCQSITTLTIPNSVTFIANYAFHNCINLISITVNSNNPNYSSENGVLFNKNKTMLITYPTRSTITSYIIPNSVTLLTAYIFNACTNLTSLTIPSSITSIPAYTIFSCANLSTVTFLGVIPTIDAGTNFTSNANDTAIYNSNLNNNSAVANSKLTMFTTKTTYTTSELITTLTNFSMPTKTFGDAAFTITPPTSNSTGVFSYTSSNTGVATINGNVITIVGGGTSTIYACQASEGDYISTSISATLTIGKATTVLSNFSIPAKTVGDASFTITPPTTNSTASFYYISTNQLVATVDRNVVTIIGPGIAGITATQVTNLSYTAASIHTLLLVNSSSATISPTITNFSIPAKSFNDGTSFNVTNPTSDSTGAFSYTSSNTLVATLAGNTLNFVGVGTTIITAYQVGNSTYKGGTISAPFTLSIGTGTINNFSIPAKNTASPNFTFVGLFTSNSPGAVTYTSSNTSVATISVNTVTIVGAGNSTITIFKESTPKFTSVTATTILSVSAGTPTLTFSIPTKRATDVSFVISPPTSKSTGNFTYTSSNTSVATISGNVVTLYGTIGSSTITANQAASPPDFLAATATSTLSVIKADTILSNFSMPAKIKTDIPFSITPPTSNRTGAFTYTSSNTAIATISGTTVSILGNLGSSTITATQGTTPIYNAQAITAVLTVTNPNPTITNFSIPLKKIGDAAFTITAPTSNSMGAFSYTSSNTAVATIAGSTITIRGIGTSTITALQASNATFNSGTITATFTVEPLLTTTVLSNFSVPAKTFGDAAFAITPPTTNSNALITYTSSNTAVATIAGSTITIVGGGTSTITASQASNANYTSGTITATLTVQATTVISNFSIPTKKFGDAAFAITPPTTNSNALITYTSSNTAVATVAGNTITIVGIGSSTITASQESNPSFTSGTITAALTVGQGTPILTNFSVPTKTVVDMSFVIIPPTTNSTGTFTYTSSNTAVAIIAGSTIMVVGAGTSTITASQASTTNYTSATVTATFQVTKLIPNLTNFSVPDRTTGSASFIITPPTTASNGAFTYTSSNTAVVTISNGNRINIIGVGSSTITASQAGTATFEPATITDTIEVTPVSSVLSNFNISEKTFGDNSFKIQASSNSSGAITYTSSNLSVATIVGDMVTIVGAGTSTITATQASWNGFASGSISDTLQVNPATTNLRVFSVPLKKFGDAPFALSPPLSNSNGLITYTSSNSAVATIAGNMVTIVGNGSSIITATQASTTNFTSATISDTLQISSIAPTITNFSIPSKTFGDADFSINAPTSNSDGAFTYLVSSPIVATIAGNIITIKTAGTITITATQASSMGYSSGSITAQFVVNKRLPVLGEFSVPAKTFGASSFKITPPTSVSIGGFNYTSSDTSVATIERDVITIVGAGTSTITVTQSSTGNYTSATTTATLEVSQATPIITNFSVPTKGITDAAFSLTAPTTNSSGLITYTSSDTEVATIDGTTLTIVGSGTSTITANQASTTNFISGTITATFRVNKVTTVLSNFSVPEKTAGNANFEITSPTTNSPGAFTYTSSNTEVATITGNTITIVGSGNSTITATQASASEYASASITAVFKVNPITTVLTNFSVPAKTFGDAAFAIIPPTTNSDGLFTYTSSNTTIATVAENMITIVGVGNCTIIADQATTSQYTSARITASFVVSQATPTITNFSIPEKQVGNPVFQITAPTSNSPGAFNYISSNRTVAIFVGNNITIMGIGTSTITATQASTANYTGGTITTQLVVNKQGPTITNFIIPAKTIEDKTFELVDPKSNNINPFTYTSSNLSVATIVGKVVTIVGAGTSIITASQSMTPNFSAGSVTATLEVSQSPSEVSDFYVPVKSAGNASFTLTPPISNSDGVFTYTSSNTSVATIDGDVVTIVGIGTTTITALQASTTSRGSATITSELLVKNPTPEVGNLVIGNQLLKNRTFTIVDPTKPVDSTGTWSYVSSDTTLATVSGNVVTLLKVGVVRITATLSGDSLYNSRILITQFSIAAKLSAFVSITSKDVENAIPTSVQPVGGTVTIPPSIFTPFQLLRFNPAVGTPIEKDGNRILIIQTILNMFPNAVIINIPSVALFFSAIRATSLTDVKILRPSGTTPIILNTVLIDTLTLFLCAFSSVNTTPANLVRLNCNGKFVGFNMRVARPGLNYVITNTSNKNKSVTVNVPFMSKKNTVAYSGLRVMLFF
jgi:hypothetical protein